MKLTEMNTKQLAAALCQLTAPMSRIATDDSLNHVFTKIQRAVKRNESMTIFEKTGMLLEAVPILLETHYADTILIIAVMTGRTPSQVEALNGYEMIAEIRESIDEQFLDFFRSSAVMARTSTGRPE